MVISVMLRSFCLRPDAVAIDSAEKLEVRMCSEGRGIHVWCDVNLSTSGCKIAAVFDVNSEGLNKHARARDFKGWLLSVVQVRQVVRCVAVSSRARAYTLKKDDIDEGKQLKMGSWGKGDLQR
jgi:hypothetical protein